MKPDKASKKSVGKKTSPAIAADIKPAAPFLAKPAAAPAPEKPKFASTPAAAAKPAPAPMKPAAPAPIAAKPMTSAPPAKSAAPAMTETKTAPAPQPAKTAAPTSSAASSDFKPTAKGNKTATIEAKVDVGFGNTLYLRGEGIKGADWNHGVPLKNVDSSTWQWTGEAEEKAKIKLLINDSVWAKGEDLVIAPGKKVQVSPSF
jgi:hypothetical protein